MPFAWMRLELNLVLPLAGLLIVLSLLGYGFARSLVDFPRWQRIASLLCRATIVTLLALALAGLTWLWPSHDPFVVFLIDHSRSIDAKARAAADEFLQKAAQAQGANRVGYL